MAGESFDPLAHLWTDDLSAALVAVEGEFGADSEPEPDSDSDDAKMHVWLPLDLAEQIVEAWVAYEDGDEEAGAFLDNFLEMLAVLIIKAFTL